MSIHERLSKLKVWTEKKHPKPSFKVYLKWKLNEHLEKEPPEMMPCAALVDMFSWTKMFSWTFVDVLEWIALDTVSKGERFTSPSGLMATWWSGLQKLMKSVIAEDISLNCWNVGRSLQDSKLASLFVPCNCSDVAIFHISRRQNIYGGRPDAVICERKIDTSSEAHILHHAVDRVMA